MKNSVEIITEKVHKIDTLKSMNSHLESSMTKLSMMDSMGKIFEWLGKAIDELNPFYPTFVRKFRLAFMDLFITMAKQQQKDNLEEIEKLTKELTP